jgi:hypothetical protein
VRNNRDEQLQLHGMLRKVGHTSRTGEHTVLLLPASSCVACAAACTAVLAIQTHKPRSEWHPAAALVVTRCTQAWTLPSP